MKRKGKYDWHESAHAKTSVAVSASLVWFFRGLAIAVPDEVLHHQHIRLLRRGAGKRAGDAIVDANRHEQEANDFFMGHFL